MTSETKAQTTTGYLDSLSKQDKYAAASLFALMASATAGFAAYENPERFKNFFDNDIIKVAGVITALVAVLLIIVALNCHYANKRGDSCSGIDETKATESAATPPSNS